MTKICIFGAGAIGGYIAACLKKTDAEISLIARGPHKKAIEEKGLTFIKNDKSENFKFNVTDDPKTLKIQDYIFISVKAHSISNIVDNSIMAIPVDLAIVTGFSPSIIEYSFATGLKPSFSILSITLPNSIS